MRFMMICDSAEKHVSETGQQEHRDERILGSLSKEISNPMKSSSHRKVFCEHCVWLIQHEHPFYINEMMQACLCNPRLKNHYLHKKIEYENPADKNRFNNCMDYRAKLLIQISELIRKVAKAFSFSFFYIA